MKELIIVLLSVAFKAFGSVQFVNDFVLIEHNGNIHSLMLSEVSIAEEARMFGKNDRIDFRSFSNMPGNNSINLSEKMSEVKNQGSRGSCSAFAAMGLVEAHMGKTHDFSEQCLIIFDNREDGGNTLTRLKLLKRTSCALLFENECPYIDPSDFEDWTKANDNERKELQIKARYQIPSHVFDWRFHFDKMGDPFSWGLSLFLPRRMLIDSVDFDFMSAPARLDHIRNHLISGRPVAASTFTPGEGWGEGMIDEIPSDEEIKSNCRAMASNESSPKKLCGSHAIVLTGFDDKRKLLFFKNSWGTNWGLTEQFQKPKKNEKKVGYGAMSYEYFARFGKSELIVLRQY